MADPRDLATAGISLAYKGIAGEIESMSPIAGSIAGIGIDALKASGLDVEKLATDAVISVVEELGKSLPEDLATALHGIVEGVGEAIPVINIAIAFGTYIAGVLSAFSPGKTHAKQCEIGFQNAPYSTTGTGTITAWNIVDDSWLGKTIRLTVCKYTPGWLDPRSPVWDKNTCEWTIGDELADLYLSAGYAKPRGKFSEADAETMYRGLVNSWRVEARKHGSAETIAHANSGLIGLSLARRMQYKRVIDAILLQVPKTERFDTPIGDQGASLWPVLVDMIYRDFDEGRLCYSFVNYCVTRSVTISGTPYMSKHTTGAKNFCYDAVFDGRTFDDLKIAALEQLHALLDSWHDGTISPKNSADQKILNEQVAALRALRAARQGEVLWRPDVSLMLGGSTISGTGTAPTKSESSGFPIAAIAIAAAAIYYSR